jgi:hypothetical protein
LGISRRKRHPVGELPVQADLEGILAGAGKGNVEHQDGSRFHVDHARRRLTELYGAFAAEELAPCVVDETDPNGMNPDLRAPPANAEHEVSAGVHRGEVREPDVLEHAEHAEFALLINQGVVGDDGKIEMQGSDDPD